MKQVTLLLCFPLFILLSTQTSCNRNSAQQVSNAPVDTVKISFIDTSKNPPTLDMIKFDTSFFLKQIDSLTKIIQANPQGIKPYVTRADFRSRLQDYQGACEDWKKALELGMKDVEPTIERYCK